MAKSKTIALRDQRHELSRRALIKWTVAAGAALGVSQTKIYEILEKTAGKGVAHAAAARDTARSVHLVAGNGGLAWFTQLWPQVAIAQSGNGNFSYATPGQGAIMPGTDKPLFVGPNTPFATLPAAKQMTGFMCGSNETHNIQALQSTVELNGNNIFAIASAIQAGASSVIPLITVGNQITSGTAPGGARPANVNDGNGIVGLFNSAASRAGGLLAKMGDASLYRAQYDAFWQLNRVAARTTTKLAYGTAHGAAAFLGTNLAAQLQITPDDLSRYGVNGGTRNNVADIAKTLIVTVKAFKMGLTNSVVLPAMLDDPHGAFDGGDVNTVPGQLKAVFDGFMNDLRNTLDDAYQTPLADDVVITIHGDTYKDPTNKSGWGDNTPNNSNMVFVYSAGHLKSGWFGLVDAQGNAQGFDPSGATTAYNGGNTAKYMGAAIAYAIAKRDERAISNFANGLTIGGGGGIGRAKDI
jgi:hypothetical protein